MTDTLADMTGTETMVSYFGHDAECLCVKCMMADMDSFVSAQGGTVYEAEKTEAERTMFRAPGTRTGNGFVRHISDRQAKYIKFLLSTRNAAGIQIYPGQTLDPTKVHTMGLPAARALIDKLLNAPEIKNAPSVRMATEGQIKFITSLNSQLANPILTESDISNITFSQVNDTLATLKEKIAEERKAPKAQTNSTSAVTEGMYKVGERIFKVQTARTSGRLYAKELIDESFEYAQGAMRIIKAEHRMTLDEAKAYGKRTGTCCNCGRELTNPESIANGIGPICAGQF